MPAPTPRKVEIIQHMIVRAEGPPLADYAQRPQLLSSLSLFSFILSLSLFLFLSPPYPTGILVSVPQTNPILTRFVFCPYVSYRTIALHIDGTSMYVFCSTHINAEVNAFGHRRQGMCHFV